MYILSLSLLSLTLSLYMDIYTEKDIQLYVYRELPLFKTQMFFQILSVCVCMCVCVHIYIHTEKEMQLYVYTELPLFLKHKCKYTLHIVLHILFKLKHTSQTLCLVITCLIILKTHI